MTLTFPGGPLSESPAESVNYSIDGPGHRLLLHPHARRVRAHLGDEKVFDTTRGSLLHETAILPRFYFPEADLRADLLEPTDHSTHCPFKGDASYWTVRAGESVAENAIWTYREPIAGAEWLRGLVSVYWEAMDTWFEEDEEVRGHLRDPYHRVDARQSSRRVTVTRGDEVIARTENPITVFETGIPTRFYIPREDVGPGLAVSEKQAICAYKGDATYYSVESESGTLEDAAWSYEDPLESALPAKGAVCFDHDELTITDEGAPQA